MHGWQLPSCPPTLSACLQQLPRLNGSVDVLDQAAVLFANAHPDIQAALAYLRTLTARIAAQLPGLQHSC